MSGQTYKISFISRSTDGQGVMKVLLKDVNGGAVFFDSSDMNIRVNQQTYDLYYTHNAADAMDVRLEFDVGSRQQVLYLDKVELIRSTPADLALALTPAGSSDVQLAFQTVSGGLYSVEFSTNLVSDAWSTLMNNIHGTAGVSEIMDEASTGEGYYRGFEWPGN